ncbi:bombyxin A-2 homolog [Leguminivora glycinivorella]|uniref:bombyxin A-2 homolog n=1 Tax=Leguminivora glycinivorella TaxID=1035111 RepID=UPI00200E97C8|nr:bombyxin A-2 homolog [Leguminivora glycinivorella]
MNSSQYLLIIMVLLGNSLMALAQDEAQEAYKLSDSINKCSKRLSQMIANLCNNMYKIVKRDTRSSLMIDKLVPEELHEHMKRSRLKRSRRRVRRQLVDECCNQPCTISNLLMYCPPDAIIVKERPEIFN